MPPAKIETRLAEVGGIIADILKPDHQASEMAIEVLKTSDQATAMKVGVAGQNAFVKMFHGGAKASAAFARERHALELLDGVQAPRLLFVAQPQRLIMTSFITGKPLGETLTTDTLILRAEHLGQWFAQLSNNAPSKVQDGNWLDYLGRYHAGFDKDLLDQQNRILGQTPLNRLTLAHNDNTLSNFILGSDKRLYAVDFEDCRMKPEGWDLVTVTSALFRRFPEDLQIIATSVLRGYRLSAATCALPDNFDQVINVLTLASAISGPQQGS